MGSCRHLDFILISLFSESAEADHPQLYRIGILRRTVYYFHLLDHLYSFRDLLFSSMPKMELKKKYHISLICT